MSVGINLNEEYGYSWGELKVISGKPKTWVASVPEGWVVAVMTYDKLNRRCTSFIGPYNTREVARTTQRCVKQMLKYT